ncbi:transcriptional regulator NrdR [Mesosutterella sp. OilRF-GAM-744-9]|uniref:Transcriptional repressor NrdR n=1 Tax=Mesosutterella porci TaxID=2915351 RepID=A0ABS9MRH0_9BURK|nr:transcriptional regulator NrdR [Mesosutterella sp. oilRF-744-WT-GAM-9]MCG5031233.1 transcriptional regulator NrdR [Mesosutterella sp. oilRF-744-WT-GAM-9]MCI6529773.1 transcriptional regulator NrdR [Mesosutterella sp.]
MRCPFCHSNETQVIDSRSSEEGWAIRRRRKCPNCGKRFTTYERVELALPAIIKKGGARTEFDAKKLRASMMLALRKRPVPLEKIDEAVSNIEQRLMALGEREVKSEKVGLYVLEELRRLDSVAYIRFASVYFNVEKPEAFVELLREATEGKGDKH